MSEISKTEIYSMSKEQNYFRGYKDNKMDVLDKIRVEIDSLEWRCDGEDYFVNRKAVKCILDKYKAESEATGVKFDFDEEQEQIDFVQPHKTVGKLISVDVLDKIRDEIDRQEKWLLQAGYNAYNVDIAFDTIKAVMAKSEE